MSVPPLLSAAPRLTILGLILGFLISSAYRRKPWVVFIWLPTASTFAYGACLILRRFSLIGKVHGPDAGFAGMEMMFLLPALGICLAGLLAAYFCRPRKEAWHPTTTIAAVAFWMAVGWASNHRDTSHVAIQLFDARGKSLANVRVEYGASEQGLGVQANLLSSDEQGRIAFDFRQGQTFGLQIMPRAASPAEMDTTPTYWNLSFAQLEKAPDQLTLRHSWQRSVADQTLNEGFTEIMPRTSEIAFSLTLPDHASLDPAPRRDRIRAAFNAFRKSHPPSLSYADVCRNVEAIEFIPTLLKAYQDKEPGSEGVVDGLAAIAAILSDLDRGCRTVERTVKNEPYYPRQKLENQILQFCIWAEVPAESRASVSGSLAAVRQKIAGHAAVLMDFALEQFSQDPNALNVPSELRLLAKPHLTRVVAALLKRPPTDFQSASRLSHPLWMMGAHSADLQLLLDSSDPLLVFIGYEATPNDELENEIAAHALARLEATRPLLTDDLAARQFENATTMLKARLKRENPQ